MKKLVLLALCLALIGIPAMADTWLPGEIVAETDVLEPETMELIAVLEPGASVYVLRYESPRSLVYWEGVDLIGWVDTAAVKLLVEPEFPDGDVLPVDLFGDSADITEKGYYSLDLDGDGADETVCVFSMPSGFEDSTVGVLVREEDGAEGMFVSSVIFAEKVQVVDVDPAAPGVEILVSGDVMSSDYETVCLRWDGGALSRVAFRTPDGTAGDCLYADADLFMEGLLTVVGKVDVLGSWWGTLTYSWDGEALSPMAGDIWHFDRGEGDEVDDRVLVTAREIPVTYEDGTEGALPAGTTLWPFATDGSTTVWYETADGGVGTIAIERNEEEYMWYIGGVSEYECFEELPYAG